MQMFREPAASKRDSEWLSGRDSASDQLRFWRSIMVLGRAVRDRSESPNVCFLRRLGLDRDHNRRDGYNDRSLRSVGESLVFKMHSRLLCRSVLQ